MRVKNSVGQSSYIFDKAKDIELPADVIARASRSKLQRFSELALSMKQLWKDVPAEFKALAASSNPMVLLRLGGTAAARTSAPSAPPAPAK